MQILDNMSGMTILALILYYCGVLMAAWDSRDELVSSYIPVAMMISGLALLLVLIL